MQVETRHDRYVRTNYTPHAREDLAFTIVQVLGDHRSVQIEIHAIDRSGLCKMPSEFADDAFGWDWDLLRPGLPLVVLGQFSYIVAIATLTIGARLKRFDRTLEEAAYNLGASRAAVLGTVTLPYLRPALVGAAAMAFLMSFENFNTTLMLVGADPPLTVMMYGRMREGASPVLNAVSLFLMLASAGLALTRPDCVAGFGLLSGRILPEIGPLIAPAAALARLHGLIIHGDGDDRLPVHFAEQSAALLAASIAGLP